MKASIVLFAVLVWLGIGGAPLLLAKGKTEKIQWRTGILLEQSSEPSCRSNIVIENGTGIGGESCSTVTWYTIDAGEITYTLSRGTFPRDSLLAVTVNAPIKFASVGKKWYIQD